MKDIAVIRRMTTEDLADEIDAALDACTQRQRLLAQNIVAGKDPGQAVMDAGYSLYETEAVAKAAYTGLSQSKKVRYALQCLNEKTQRESMVTAIDVRLRMWDCYRKAMADDDTKTALRSLEMLARLDGLNVNQELKIKLESRQIQTRVITSEEWEALSQLEHVVSTVAN